MNSGCDHSFTKKVPNKVCQNTATDEDQCSNAVVSPNLAAKVISSPGVSTDTVLTNKDTVTNDSRESALGWPLGASVNAGIDKTSYLNSAFSLTFPTVDVIIS